MSSLPQEATDCRVQFVCRLAGRRPFVVAMLSVESAAEIPRRTYLTPTLPQNDPANVRRSDAVVGPRGIEELPRTRLSMGVA